MRQTKKQLQEDILETSTLRELMTAYEEVAALKMKRIREQVLKSREFHTILTGYFHEVRQTPLPHDSHLTTMTMPENKHLAILLSDDKGLYGEILSQTQEAFITAMNEHPDYHIAVVGTLPLETLKASLPGREIQVFPFSGQHKDFSSLHDLFLLLGAYTDVTVFHGTFMSLINQTAKASHLTGEEDTKPEATVIVKQYILEPSLPELKEFFQKEILRVLFEQALLEGTLSKEASRMVSLQKASDEAQKRVQKLQRLSRLATNQHTNKEQITYLAGLSLWQIQ